MGCHIKRSQIIILALRLASIACLLLVPGAASITTAGLAWMPLGLIYPVLATGCSGVCGLGRCASNQASKTFSMTISGLANGTCTSCNDYNATFGGIPNSVNCSWRDFTIVNSCGTLLSHAGAEVDITDNGTRVFVVGSLFLSLGGGSSNAWTWDIGALASPPVCCITTLGPLTPGVDSISGGATQDCDSSATQDCDSSGASMTLVGSDH
jgi:hypothetical protein